MTARTAVRRLPALAAALAVVGAVGAGALAAPSASPARAADTAAAASPANPPTGANPHNPLAGRPWGVYQGMGESPWAEYNGRLSGVTPPTEAQKKDLIKIVDTPKARWFSDLETPATTRRKVLNTIESVTDKDPNALVQLLTFGMTRTWEYQKCPNTTAYKRWAQAFAAGVRAGHAHTAIVVQMDGPLAARCRADRSMVHYTVQLLHQIPNTVIYIEMGSADWPAVVGAKNLPKKQVAQSATLLKQDGIGMARGFALATSHFDSTGAEIAYGVKLVHKLGSMGFGRKHFVIDTSDNGAPFTGAWWHRHHPHLALDQATPCTTRSATHCVKLGIPPTPDVDNAAWHLTSTARQLAATYVDAYLWLERPWQLPKNKALGTTGKPGFKLRSALLEVRTSRWNPLVSPPAAQRVIGAPK